MTVVLAPSSGIEAKPYVKNNFYTFINPFGIEAHRITIKLHVHLSSCKR